MTWARFDLAVLHSKQGLSWPFFANKDDFWGPQPRLGSAIDQRCDQFKTLGKSSSFPSQFPVSSGVD